MAFIWETPPKAGSLRQCEILGSLWEHRPLLPPTEAAENLQIRVKSLRHELMVVMSPDCDLIWDFRARFVDDPAREALEPEADDVDTKAAAMPHVLLCEAYDAAEVKARVSESRLWKNIQQNRDERYHHFDPAPIADPRTGDAAGEVGDVFFDFKKPLAIATTFVYEGLRGGQLKRLARVPPPYRYDLMQRFYSFQSRVAVPPD
jgi:hypothetical protein